MEKKKIIYITFINFAILIALAIPMFLLLPANLQKSLSVILYAFAIIVGLVIGNLVAKIYYLKKKLNSQNEDLKKKHENLQLYIGNVVHDLRSPLAAINMIAELLESDLREIEPSNMELISSMRVSSHNMLERICTLLDNTKAQNSSMFDNMQAQQPERIIRGVINKLHILAIEKNIEINLNLTPGLPSVYFDEFALDSIFTNLLSNAIKYSMPNTTITVFDKAVHNQIVYCVKDQGLGMNKDDLLKVFGRYTKLSAQPTGGEDSSGLGLSIAKDLAEKMHGDVKAYSEGKGKGSTFSVTLSTTAKAQCKTA